MVLLLFFTGIVSCKKKDKVPDTQQYNSAVKVPIKNSIGHSDPETIIVELPGLQTKFKKLEMVLISPGRFIMGSPEDELGRSENEWPSHEVIISKPFYLGMYEITQAQWELVMGERKNRSFFKNKPDHPVEKVSWIEAQKFIKRINKLGLGKFRLPTEAEWEYSCKAGTNRAYSFEYNSGFADIANDFAEIAGKYIWWKGNSISNITHNVGYKLPNPWGLYDMHGNVWEWCSDKYEKPYKRNIYKDSQESLSWVSSFLFLKNRVSKGGSFITSLNKCRSSSRMYEQALDYHYSMGLRLVREYIP